MRSRTERQTDMQSKRETVKRGKTGFDEGDSGTQPDSREDGDWLEKRQVGRMLVTHLNLISYFRYLTYIRVYNIYFV